MTKFAVFFLVIFSPLAFGTKEPWSYGVMEIVTSVGLIALVISVIKKKATYYQVPGLLFLILFQAYILFQIIPLPCQLVEFLSPRAFAIHSAIDEITLVRRNYIPISINPFATLIQFFRYAVYAGFYILAVQILKEKKTLRNVLITIIIFGGILSFSSILQLYIAKDMALWIRYTPVNSMLMGPYANHNHYAGLMEMIFPLVLSMFLFYRPRIKGASFFRSIREIFTQEKANIHILIGFSAALIFISIILSLSRGGIISTCLSLSVFSLLIRQRSSEKRGSLLIMGGLIFIIISISWFGWDNIFDRFALLSNTDNLVNNGRAQFWMDSKNIIKDFPLTGAGMGCFEHIYPPYKTLLDDMKLKHAHNDYIQLLVEGGIIGFGIIAFFIISLISRTYKKFLKRRDGFSIYLYIGSITGMISIFCHSFTDFNFQVGANGLWFYFIAAIAVSAANTKMNDHYSPTRLIQVSSPAKKLLFCATAGIFALATIGFQVKVLTSHMYFSYIKDYTITKESSFAELIAMGRLSDIASKWNSFWAAPWYSSAIISIWKQEPNKIRKYFIACLERDPLNSEYLSKYASLLPSITGNKNHPIIGKTYELAANYNPTRPEYTLQYGAWLLHNGRTKSGLEQMKKTLLIKDSYTEKIIRTMILANVDQEEMREGLPDLPRPLLAYAKFLQTIGLKQKSIHFYIETLDLLKAILKKDRWIYYDLYYFFKNNEKSSYAMETMLTAEKALPRDAGIKVTLGDIYRKQGILFKAKEKYQAALMEDAKNYWAKKWIKTINAQESTGRLE